MGDYRCHKFWGSRTFFHLATPLGERFPERKMSQSYLSTFIWWDYYHHFILFATDRYQSLGEEIIQASFIQHVYPWDFLGKIFMTTLSLGSGFRGGEVMPLFYIGATLGNALSFILPLAIPFLSALGFVAVFAGAANVPITSFILAIGLFGPTIAVYAAIAVVVSYLVSGHKGIYKSHRKHRFKKF